MSWLWYLACAVTAVGAVLAAWSARDLRQRSTDVAADADRCRALADEAGALGRDVGRLRSRLAIVEARAASERRPGAG